MDVSKPALIEDFVVYRRDPLNGPELDIVSLVEKACQCQAAQFHKCTSVEVLLRPQAPDYSVEVSPEKTAPGELE